MDKLYEILGYREEHVNDVFTDKGVSALENTYEVMKRAGKVNPEFSSMVAHSMRVVNIATQILWKLEDSQHISIEDRAKIDPVYETIIKYSCIFHDIDKKGWPEKYFSAHRKELTEDELEHFEDVRLRHPEEGANFVTLRYRVETRDFSEEMILPRGMNCLVETIKTHQELYDGKGYPDKLIGEQIPLSARILTVADSFDAMTSNRPYRITKHTIESALDEIMSNAGTQFCPNVVDSLKQLEYNLESNY